MKCFNFTYLTGRKFFAEKEVPRFYEEIKAIIQADVKEVLSTNGKLSFTTDIWSRDGGLGSMMSLTAHFHYKSKCKPRVLKVAPFEGCFSFTKIYINRHMGDSKKKYKED